jgi:hypothetical protein
VPPAPRVSTLACFWSDPEQGREYLTRRNLHACLALILAVSVATLSAPLPAIAQDLDVEPEFASEPIPDIWAQADSESSRSAAERSWIWGPSILSATHEPYVESPSGHREVYYFDKARMEINDPSASWDSLWYATSGLLIREMMLGQIQVGDSTSIDTKPAEIPVTGDLEDNPQSPTYATLGQLTVFGGQDENRAPDRTGEPVNAFLAADGTVSTIANPSTVTEVAYYDDTLGFNVPAAFWNWMNAQPIDWRYVIGHPVTEPYWVDTMIGGEPETVLVQAFERRVLTFNPANARQWQVEAGNAGLHYRAWRDLSMPENPRLHALAFSIPYGEIIAEAADRNGVDAYLLAGVAEAASGFDPSAELTSDRVGLMGVPLPLLEQRGVEYPLDPTFNVRVAADLLAMLHNQNGSWESALEEYFGWQDAVGTFASPPTHVTSEAIAAWQEFEASYAGQPSPFGVEIPDEPPAPPEPRPTPPPASDDDADDRYPDLYFVGAGRAAHYGKEAYPVEEMERIMDVHTSWEGGAIPDWEYDPNGYYCVHPDFIVGERLHLTAPNGDTFWCTIVDYVRVEHQDYWRANWAIEVNWDLFEAMGVPYEQRIEVRAPRD